MLAAMDGPGVAEQVCLYQDCLTTQNPQNSLFEKPGLAGLKLSNSFGILLSPLGALDAAPLPLRQVWVGYLQACHVVGAWAGVAQQQGAAINVVRLQEGTA